MTDQSISPHKKASNFSFDVLKLASGTAFAQGLTVLASPLLTRLYSPDAYGTLALFTAIASIIAALVCLRYELTILLPDQEEDAANLFAGSFLISVVISLLTIPGVWWFGSYIGLWLKSPTLTMFLWLLPPVVFFGGIGAGHPILNAWASRKRNFTQITIAKIIASLARVGTSLVAGFIGLNAIGLILGGLVGSILSPLWMGWQIWKLDWRFLVENIRWKKIWAGLVRYRKFPFYDFPSAMLNTISWQVPSFMLSAFFSTSVVGYYALADQVLRVPMNLIGLSVGQAFYAHAVTSYREGTLAVFVENTFRRLVEYSCVPILLLSVIGKELFVIVFGSGWSDAGGYTQVLSLLILFWFVSSPMSHLFQVMERNELAFGLNIAILFTRIGSIWLGGVLKSPYQALLLYSISGAIIYGYMSFLIIRLAGASLRRIGAIFMHNILIALCAILGILVLKSLDVYPIYQLIAVALLVIIYYSYRVKLSWPIKSGGM